MMDVKPHAALLGLVLMSGERRASRHAQALKHLSAQSLFAPGPSGGESGMELNRFSEGILTGLSSNRNAAGAPPAQWDL